MSDFFQGSTWSAMLEYAQKSGCLPRNSKEIPTNRMIFLELISESRWLQNVKIVVLGLAKPFNSEHAYLWAIFFKALREAQCLNTHRKVVFGRETPGNSHESNDFSRADFRILVHQNVKFLVLGCGKNHSIPSTRIYERFFWRLYVKRNAWIRTEKWLFAKKLQGNSHESNDFSRADFRIEVAPECKNCGFGVGKTIQFRARVFMSDFFQGSTWSAMLEYAQKSGFWPRNSRKFPRIEWFFSSWFQNLGAPERRISGFGLW